MAEPDIPTDWTAGPDGRTNSSETYQRIAAHVEALIRQDAHRLIAGRADMTAGLIVAQLAHKHGLAPPPDGTETPDGLYARLRALVDEQNAELARLLGAFDAAVRRERALLDTLALDGTCTATCTGCQREVAPVDRSPKGAWTCPGCRSRFGGCGEEETW